MWQREKKQTHGGGFVNVPNADAQFFIA